MKKGHSIQKSTFAGLSFLIMMFAVSCQGNHAQLSAADSATVKNGVSQLASNIAADVSKNGPRAWLNYFEDSPGFFMVNQGQLAFKDYPSAKNSVLNTVIKRIPQIKLKWQHLRVDPLADDLAAFGADFHEDITFSDGKALAVDGYFTALAHYNGRSWKLRNLHWSDVPNNNAPK